jgi:hypothetical protein
MCTLHIDARNALEARLKQEATLPVHPVSRSAGRQASAGSEPVHRNHGGTNSVKSGSCSVTTYRAKCRYVVPPNISKYARVRTTKKADFLAPLCPFTDATTLKDSRGTAAEKRP